MVFNGVLQNPMKKHRKFARGLCSIFFSELAHRVLNNVQRHIVVAYGKKRKFVGAPFDFNEEIREFSARSQELVLFLVPRWHG